MSERCECLGECGAHEIECANRGALSYTLVRAGVVRRWCDACRRAHRVPMSKDETEAALREFGGAKRSERLPYPGD